MIDLTPIFNAVIALAVALVSAFVIPWIKSRLNEDQLGEALAWVKIAVSAAEQIFKGSGKGHLKKEYVLNFMEEQGYLLDEAQLDAAIEAAVLELKEAVTA